ncbi:MAG TPA: acetolactate synthase [Mycobacteriales bacterium]|jgi:acetolactate synthase-1/2/3 large subunit|nr:acetolactate synthase [Mycobacteriales bacterium]
METIEGHGGDVAVAALRAAGVEEMFTLSGGHVFPVYDAAVRQKMRIVDVRHEQTATFAAEGTAKLTRRPGLAVVTAGPGVTNSVSAVTSAYFTGVPLVVLGGRAPTVNWGRGGLQELDHVPILAPVTKLSRTATTGDDIGPVLLAAAHTALSPHRGPVFVDVPMDTIFSPASASIAFEPPAAVAPDPDAVAAIARLIAAAERPAIIAGGDVWTGRAEQALRRAAAALDVPVFANGMGRGCLPADDPRAFSRVRGLLKKEADLVVVVGTPLDFRLAFGDFGSAAVVHVADSAGGVATHRELAGSASGDLAAILDGLAATGAGHAPWVARLREAEDAARAKDEPLLAGGGPAIRPPAVYGALRSRLARDAVVVGDGGDFVSYAGKYVDSYEPGCWLDPGPYGCLGTGLGYAMAARIARPSAQVVLLLGDGAAGFSLMDVDTLVRHDLPVVMVVGNNGAWGLEKHPMRQIYGYDVAAELRPETRYDEVVRALGGGGETVREPAELGPALDRAFASGVPYLVNVLTDPDDAYPRSSVLA